MLAGSIMLKFRLRVSHPERPAGEYLAEQKNKILARIGLFRRNLRWFLPPSVLGLLLWQVAPIHSVIVKWGLLVLVILQCIIVYWLMERKIRKDMLSVVEEIDQEIDDYKRKALLED
jgi:hypothetical protein